jgi:hypothetical protein
VGHDIYARFVYSDGPQTERFLFLTEEEIADFLLKRQGEGAYLRRGAYNPLAREIYAALNCHELDGGVSGTAGERAFSRDEFERALAYLRGRKGEGLEIEDEITFVEACLSWLSGGDDGEVVIWFA